MSAQLRGNYNAGRSFLGGPRQQAGDVGPKMSNSTPAKKAVIMLHK